MRELACAPWYGGANRLSHDEAVRWEVIDDVAIATRKPASEAVCDATEAPPADSSVSTGGPVAGQIILQRRSLQACDGRTSIP